MRPSLVQSQVLRPSPPPRPVLRVVPEPEAPPERRVAFMVTIALVVLAMLVGATAGYVWQHRLMTDRDASIAALQVDLIRLGDQLGVQEGRMAESQRVVITQQEFIQGLRTRNANLHLRYQIAIGNEQASQQALLQSQAELQAANETVRTLVGPQLADGTYVGYLMAVGSQQSPPRLVIDRAKMVPDQGLVNELPAWRTVRISPTASVVVLSLRPYHPQTISLDRLAHLFVNPAPWADRVTYAPFRIIVSGEVVTSIREFRPTS
jgi:hypothetical protein